MFSPYYAWRRRRGAADPEAHVALNVALYGGTRRWCMTERGRSALQRGPDHLSIGPSAMRWQGDCLVITMAERGMPIPRRVVGEVRVRPLVRNTEAFLLNPEGGHVWQPIAPLASITVDLERPRLHWHGRGYLDHNRGDAPLEAGFLDWTWMRAETASGALITYAGRRRGGDGFALGLRFGAEAGPVSFVPPPAAPLPGTGWRISREAPCDGGSLPAVRSTLEDTPFYARSLVETTLDGERMLAVHESLSLTRFAHPLVQAMLPFRMPRRAHSA